MKAVYIPLDAKPRVVNFDPADGYARFLGTPYTDGLTAPFGKHINLITPGNDGYFPNRVVFATEDMAARHVESRMRVGQTVWEGEPFAILCGDIIALGHDAACLSEQRGLTQEEAGLVVDYFTRVSPPGSGSDLFRKLVKGCELC